MDIDSSMVARHSSTPEDIVMVNNGCLGCTVKGLAKLLLSLKTFNSDELLSWHIKLYGVVTLVD